jgi:hypothetical protein
MSPFTSTIFTIDWLTLDLILVFKKNYFNLIFF